MVADARMLENISELELQILDIFVLIFETTGIVTLLWKHLGCIGLTWAKVLETGSWIRSFRALSNWALCICSEGGSAVSLGSLFQCLELSCHCIPEHAFFPPRAWFLLPSSLDSFQSAFLNCRILAPWSPAFGSGSTGSGLCSALLLSGKGSFPRTLWLWHFMIGRTGFFSGTFVWWVVWKLFPSIQVQSSFNLCASAWSGNSAALMHVSILIYSLRCFFMFRL